MASSSAASPTACGGGRSPSPAPLPAPPPPISTSSRRLPPPCWTHDETVALIDSYQDKWYSLRRGNLRAPHWEEIADAVCRRCHRLPGATPKTSVQCRHKVEKLRKRFRAEKKRSLSHYLSAPPTSSWVYFCKMDAMERGGVAASSRPTPSPSPAPAPSDDDDDEEGDDYPGARSGGTTSSLHRLMANGGGGSGIGGLKFRIPKAVRSKVVGSRAEEAPPPPRSGLNSDPGGRSLWGFGGSMSGAEEMRRSLEKKRIKREGEAVGEMVMALRMLGDGFMRMEQMKMEMAREMEKVRMDMELKRTEMMLDCQRRIADLLFTGLAGKKKKASVSPDS